MSTQQQQPFSITANVAAAFDGGPADGPETSRRSRVRAARVVANVLTRALDLTTGAGSIGTLRVAPVDFIEAARNRSIAGLLGARFPSYGGGEGKVSVPRFTAGATASWIAEGSPPGAGTNATLDNVLLTPGTVSAFCRVTRSMLAKAGPDLDAWVMTDLAGAVGAAIDAAVFGGTGASNQPLGLVLHPDVPAVAIGTNGGAPTRAHLIAALKAVHSANGNSSASASLGWATGPNGEAKLRSVDGSTGEAGAWLWSDSDTILGKPAYSSKSVPEALTKGSGTGLTALIYGNFDELIINTPESIDFIVNPYTYAPDVEIVALLEVAVAVRRPTSFAKIVDLLPTP